jgi:hypothetical protein
MPSLLSRNEAAVNVSSGPAAARLSIPEPVVYTPSAPPSTVGSTGAGGGDSCASSIFDSSQSSEDDDRLLGMWEHEGYDSPPPADERIAEIRNERRYRMLLGHEFHPSCVSLFSLLFLSLLFLLAYNLFSIVTLPLWTPSPVALGAVGYLSKPKGEFVTLFNAFSPEKAADPNVKALPSIWGYGRLNVGSYRQDKRNAVQRGVDAIQGLLTFKGRSDGPMP